MLNVPAARLSNPFGELVASHVVGAAICCGNEDSDPLCDVSSTWPRDNTRLRLSLSDYGPLVTDIPFLVTNTITW